MSIARLLTIVAFLAITTAKDVYADVQSQIIVRNGSKVQTIPLVVHPEGGLAFRADLLAAAIDAKFVAASPTNFRFDVNGTEISFTAGIAFAATKSDTFPMTASAYRLGTRLYLPRSVVADLLPRATSGFIFDGEKNELRRFVVVTTQRPVETVTRIPAAQNATQNAVQNAMQPAVSRPTTAARLTGNRRRVVVVDAGHGGVDPGMSAAIGGGKRVVEKNVTLAVANALQEALKKRGVTVVMTRTRDTLIALSDRGHIANQAKGDLFLSIHVNAANPKWTRPSSVRGFETYFLAEAKTEDEKRVEAMENEAIRFETNVDASRNDPLGFIIRDMAQNEHLRESSRLAELVQGGMKTVHPGSDRGVKQAGFRVLVAAFMPAVLIEIGFGTNPADGEWMLRPERQQEIAESIADAAISYLAEYERKVGGQ